MLLRDIWQLSNSEPCNFFSVIFYYSFYFLLFYPCNKNTFFARTTIMQPRYGRSILQLTDNITLITNHEMIQLPIARELQC